MSGDVQPRKRNKDKKKRKDDEDIIKEKTTPSGVHSTKMGPDDIQFHVHSDHGTGGHWCAKLVFFSLMAVLLGLIGLILLENRGLADLDTPLSESRFADVLEGWVDEKREVHDEHDSAHAVDEHDEDEDDEHEPYSEEEEDDVHDHDEKHDDDEHDDEDEGIENDQEESENSDENADNDDQDEDDKQTDDEDDDVETSNDNDNKVDDSNRDNEDEDGDGDEDEDKGFEEGSDEKNEEEDDDDNNQADDDINENEKIISKKTLPHKDTTCDKTSGLCNNRVIDKVQQSVSEHSTQTEESLIGDSITAKKLEKQVDELIDKYNKLAETLDRPKFDELAKNVDVVRPSDDGNASNVKRSINKNQKEDDNEADNEGNNDEDDDDDDDDDDINDDSIEEVIDNDTGEDLHLEKLAKNDEADENTENDDDEDGSSSLAVKIIVGLALVIVAHQVLVKKPETSYDDADESANGSIEENEELAAMKRRMTLVTAEENIPSDDEQPPELYGDEVEIAEYSEEDDVPLDENHEIIIEDIESDDHCEPMTFEQMEKLYKPKQVVESLNSSEALIQAPSSSQIQLERNVQVTPNEPVDQKLEKVKEVELENEDLISEEEYEYSDDEVYDNDIEEEEGDEDISDVDDHELMKRLEEKYGKLPKRPDAEDEEDNDDIDPTWTKIDTNDPTEDPIEDEIRKANERLQDDPKGAISLFKTILQTHPNSLGAIYGNAKAMDRLSELNRSNALLKEAIRKYQNYLEFGQKLNDSHFKEVAEHCIERLRFLGEHLMAVPFHEKLIERFNDDPYYRNQLAVTYLLINRLSDAKLVLHTTLQRWRNDGFAAVHYGFVLKNLDKDFNTAVIFLRQGIDSGAKGTQDGRFYFALGDSLMRLGQRDEAQEIYNQAAKKKLFLSPYQRSLYNVNRLKSRPFWTVAESGYKQEFRALQDNWKRIRDEGFSVLNNAGYFVDESENLRDFGDWKQFELFARGQKNGKNCARTPFTCKIIETFAAARFCRRGQVKFSVMHPNTHVWPHCGPTNCRLRAHLGLKIPEKTFLRVVNETRTWEEGKIFIFDDSFEHEVWHNGTSFRLILIVDVWHPDLTQHERQTLAPI